MLCRAGDVVHVPLPDLSLSRAGGLQTWLWDFLSRKSLLSRFRGDLNDEPEVEDRGGRVTPRNALDILRELLAALWDEVVKPIMDVISTLALVCPRYLVSTASNIVQYLSSIQPTVDGALPHVTWCPTGPLVFLPLHAAGIYPNDENDRTPIQSIIDIAVSSYTPTLEALLKPGTKAAVNGEHLKTLVVSQPNTLGCSPIGGTSEEAAIVMSLLDPSATNCLDDTDGTVDAVLEGMKTHSWVHLACHGIQDHAGPLQSAFALYDGPLTLETLMTKHFPNAELAVLSACQTATGDEKLSEEAVHLAAGMLNVGYKSVIGTMWSISDSIAPVVMKKFYEVMAEQVKKGGELQPAYALHEATKILREKYGISNFVRWMPFVHFGL